MIVLAWFVLISLIILFGFVFLGVTFWHWFKEARAKRKAAASAATFQV